MSSVGRRAGYSLILLLFRLLIIYKSSDPSNTSHLPTVEFTFPAWLVPSVYLTTPFAIFFLAMSRSSLKLYSVKVSRQQST